MSEALRCVLVLVLCAMVPVVRADGEKGQPTKQEMLEEAKWLEEHPGNLFEEGRYAEAILVTERQMKLWEAALGKDHPNVAECLYRLGVLYQAEGAYEKAEPAFVRALQIYEAARGKDHPDVAYSLDNLAGLYQAEGAYDKAESLHLRALQIWEKTPGKDQRDLAVCLNNLAFAYYGEGAYDKAKPLYLRALRILEAAPDKNQYLIAQSLALSLKNLAGLYRDQGAYAEAEPLLLRSVHILESLLGKDHPDVARSLNALALLYQYQEAYDKAEPVFARALQIREAALGKDHPDVAVSLNNLGRLYQAQGASQQALRLFNQAFLIAEHTLRTVRLLTTESRLDSFLQTLQTDMDVTYGLPLAIPRDPGALRLALATTLLRKGRSLDETALASREFFDMQSRLAGIAEQAEFTQLQSLRRKLAEMYLHGQQQAEGSQRLEAQVEELEQKLAHRSLALREGRQTPGPEEIVSRVSRALPRDGVLVEVVLYRPFQFRATGKQSQWGTPRYLALMLSPGETIEARDLGPAAPIDSAVADLLDQLADRESLPAAYLLAAQALYHKVFAPVVAGIHDHRQIFLSLDGQLQQVPFAALHDGTSFLLDRYHFTYLSSGRDLLRPGTARERPLRMVVMANPDFAHGSDMAPSTSPIATAPLVRLAAARGDRSPNMAQMLEHVGELPGTQAEADLLKRRFPRATVLVREAATKSALLGQQAPGILHLATHGLFVEDTPSASGQDIPRSRGGWKIVKLTAPPAADKDPEVKPLRALSRSALMLAGAKAARDPARPDADDGLVTALEVAGMNLRGTQLVVLSACETGRGEVKRGEGLYGFRRAFFLAGAETLVTSLWKVDDQATVELMDSYYGRLQAGTGRVAAMEEAMKAMRKQHEHPFHWAPFIVLGRGDPVRGLKTASRQ